MDMMTVTVAEPAIDYSVATFPDIETYSMLPDSSLVGSAFGRGGWKLW
jgi:hypothetical protein